MQVLRELMTFCKRCMRNKKHDECFERLDGKTYLVCQVCHTATEVEGGESNA